MDGAGYGRRAVVIGSGFGGLAAAVRLGRLGYRVTVLERLDQPGGRALVHRQDGYTFDAGPTIVTAPFLFEELWQCAGRRLADDVELVPLEPFYRIRFDDGRHFDYGGDPLAMRREVAKFSPRDVAGYERLLELTARIYAVGFEELATVSFHRWQTMAGLAPAIVRLKGYRSVHGLVASCIRDPFLRMVFSFHPLLVGGNPFTTTAIYSLINHLERAHGVHYAMGGTGALVDGLVRLVEAQGNELRLSSEVARIDVRDSRATGVTLASGESLAADVVVSNADPAFTYRNLLPRDAVRRWTPARLGRSASSMSLFVWYFGTDRRYEDVPHHTILMGPRYRGLLDDIFVDKRLARDMSLYLHRPTATDPSLAPAGCDAFYVLSPVPNLDGDTDWASHAETYRRRIEARLAETVLPGLGNHVATSRLMTPLDFRDRLRSFRGAAFAHEPKLTQSAWFRPHNRSEDVDGLYLVGAGTHPGAGLPGVLSSAKVLEGLLTRV